MTTATNPGNYVDFDEYVGLKLEKTRSTIRTTDLLTALAGVAAMFLGYLLVFVVLDQWVIRDGFGIVWRWILLSTLVLSTIAWLVWKVGVPSLRTVNGLFAAREIEKAEPDLKSNLLNLIDLKAAGRTVNPAILRAMERQAAVRLQQVDVSQAIDHKPLVRTAYVLLAVIVLFCFYALISPKKISNSIWRGLLPASSVAPATITEIVDVKPGDIVVPAHQPFIDVQVDLAGQIPAQVWLMYSTADGKQDQPVELHPEQEGTTRFKGQLLGEGGLGLMQDLTYVIHAGDASSRQYKITVEQPPYAEVQNVRFEFPPYMKLAPAEQQGNGAIDQWEGTSTIISAKTNMPVRSAALQFLDDPAVGPTGEEIPMQVTAEGRQLQVQWTLALRSDGSFPKYYRIHCRTEDGRVTTGHVMNPLTIRPDLAPEIVLRHPDHDLSAPANATIPLLIQAQDPDFEMGYVFVNVEKGGQRILHEKISEGRQQKLMLKHELPLGRLNAAVNETLELWIEGYDNKQPRPNSRNTPKIKIQIEKAASAKEAEKQLADQRNQVEQKVADAEQDLNRDQIDPAEQKEGERGEQTPPNDPGNDRRDSTQPQPQENQQHDGQKTDAQNQQQAAGKQAEGTDGQKTGPNSQGRPDGTKRQQTERRDQTGSDRDSQKPLNSDGSQDDEALRRISEELEKNQKSNQNQSSDQRPAEQNKTDQNPTEGSSNESTGDQSTDQTGSKKNQRDASTPKTDRTQKTDSANSGKDTGDMPEKSDERNAGSPESDKNNTDKSDAASANPAQPKPQKSPAGKTDDANSDSKPEATDPDQQPGKTSEKPKNQSDSDQAGKPKSDLNKPSKDTEKSESTTKPDQSDSAKKSDNVNQQDRTKTANKEEKTESPKKSAGEQPAAKDDKTAGSKADQPQPGREKPDAKSEGESPEPSTKGNDSKGPSEATKEASDDQDPKRGMPKDSTDDEQGRDSKDQQPDGKASPQKQDQDGTDSNKQKSTDRQKSADNKDGQKSQDPQKAADAKANDQLPNGLNEQAPKGGESGPDGKGKPEKGTDQQKNTDKTKSTGEKEQVPDSADAQKEAADGTEKGVGKPDRDPTTKPTPTQNDNVTRDPNEDPSTRPADDSTDSNPPKSDKSNKKPKNGSQNKKPTEPQPPSESDQSKDKMDGQGGGSKPESKGNSDSQEKGTDKDSSEAGDQSESDKSNESVNSKKSTGGSKQQKAASDGGKPGSSSKDSAAGNDGSGDASGEKPEKKSGDQGAGDKRQQAAKQPDGKGKSDQGAGEKQDGAAGEKKDGNSSKEKGGGGGPGKGAKPATGLGKSNTSGQTPGDGAGASDSDGNGKVTSGGDFGETERSDDANMEYNRQATELILQKLQKDLERGDVDPELLERLGWTESQMQQFADRISKSLKQSKQSEETPEAKARQQQFQEMLKGLDLQKSGSQRSGAKEPKRDINQVESKRTQAPPAYRSAFEKFTRDMARQKQSANEKSGK